MRKLRNVLVEIARDDGAPGRAGRVDRALVDRRTATSASSSLASSEPR